MKLLNRVGDALLARLAPGLDAKANCGQCQYRGETGSCTPRCCRNGRQYHAQTVTDLCGRACNYICWWGMPCTRAC